MKMDNFRKVVGILVILSTFVYMTSQAPSSKRSWSLQINLFKNATLPTATPNDSSIHPCNRVGIGGRRIFTVIVGNETVVCHRLNDTELLSVEKCRGSSQQKFAAVKIEKAVENAETMFKDHSSKPTSAPGIRVKRSTSLYLKPDETMVCNCKSRNSRDVTTNLGRPCGVCASIYRQANSNRFPQYVNGVVCHPNETEVVKWNGQEIGKCIQKTFTQDFLQWNRKWVEDVINSKRTGKMVYKQEWEPYTHTINSSCVFQLMN